MLVENDSSQMTKEQSLFTLHIAMGLTGVRSSQQTLNPKYFIYIFYNGANRFESTLNLIDLK